MSGNGDAGQIADPKTEPAALSWARSQGGSGFEVLSEQPWSSVWRCRTAGGMSGILKAIARPRRAAVHLPRPLSRAQPEHVPAIFAQDPERGLFLMEDVACPGKPAALGADPVEEILSTYGAIQAAAASQDTLLRNVPALSASETFEAVLGLASRDSADTPGNPFGLLEHERRRDMMAALSGHAKRLRALAAEIDGLQPVTLNHTDLRGDNMLHRPSGALCIFDWDDAGRSAPGWSLNMQFSGCLRVHAALWQSRAYKSREVLRRDRRALDAYIGALTRTGVFQSNDLRQILPKTAAFGILKYVADMAPYDLSDEASAQAVRRAVLRRFADFERYISLIASGKGVPARRKESHDMNQTDNQPQAAPGAAQPASFPGFDVRGSGTEDFAERATRAARAFRRMGALHIKGCFDRAHLMKVLTEFNANHDAQKEAIDAGRALRVGDKRYMFSLPTNGALGQPEVLAAEPLLAILDRLLSPGYVLGSLTAVVAMGGSQDQQWHRDNAALFPELPKMKVPPVNIAVLVPLVPLDAEIGATEVLPGSHLDFDHDDDTNRALHPEAEVGDCYLMDSRLLHRGMANRSERPRPVLSLVYQRPWYRDYQNFNNQPALEISPETLARFPEARRALVSWAATA